ncbi:lactonase family protein [Clostridium frigoris]|uniref:Lactonase family protein n=1 Tax=Clostridium frigoris TaxID=205327 RepID=A0ABS6BVG9_9CLOT|nr:lactonase family protein [Clostridium frigoris]MBU3160922.1 lactonase family protein [Clostridium frigoris]
MENLSKKYIAYVGTYTSNGSQGIYSYNLDIKSGRLEQIGVSSKVDNPSYLNISHDNKFLYAVLENEVFNGEAGGAVAAFRIDQKTGEIKLLNIKGTKGKAPCNVCIARDNKYVFVANYNEGTVSVFQVNEDGSLGSISTIVEHEGSGPNKIRQTKPHVHYVTLTPEEKYLCVVDLGIDSIKFYEVDRKHGSLIINDKLSLIIKPGSGPRHMEFDPSGKTAYIITELSCEVLVVQYCVEKQTFDIIQHISTLPKGYVGENICGAIHISPDGNYLYASNRGDDSLAIFKIEKTSGILELVGHSATYGECPRDFGIDPTGKFMYVLNQDSDTIVTFKIVSESGKLEVLAGDIKILSPVCIKFISL